MSSEVTKKVRLALERERLRRAAADGEQLYRKRMHDPNGPTLADDNRIDGILTLDLTDALGALDFALGEAERMRKALTIAADLLAQERYATDPDYTHEWRMISAALEGDAE